MANSNRVRISDIILLILVVTFVFLFSVQVVKPPSKKQKDVAKPPDKAEAVERTKANDSVTQVTRSQTLRQNGHLRYLICVFARRNIPKYTYRNTPHQPNMHTNIHAYMHTCIDAHGTNMIRTRFQMINNLFSRFVF